MSFFVGQYVLKDGLEQAQIVDIQQPSGDIYISYYDGGACLTQDELAAPATLVNDPVGGWTCPWSPPQPITDANIAAAVALWISDKALALTTYGDIRGWDTTGVVLGFKELFLNNATWTGTGDDDCSAWNTENGTDFEGMYKDCPLFNPPAAMQYWNVEKATTLKEMFRNAPLVRFEVARWRPPLTANVDDMFKDADQLSGKYTGTAGYGNTPDIPEFFYLETTPQDVINELEEANGYLKDINQATKDGVEFLFQIDADTSAIAGETAAILTETEEINIDTTTIIDEIDTVNNNLQDNTTSIVSQLQDVKDKLDQIIALSGGGNAGIEALLTQQIDLITLGWSKKNWV